jgi:cytosine/adenosine deaminase-related metal-dependent hydrolase
MRLGSGIAPVRRMRDLGVSVGLGVDGSASNDGAHMLGEVRMGMLLQRVTGAAMTAREALEIATRGGAEVLNRDDIGHLAPGMSADLAIYPLDDVAQAGAQHDPLAALLLCQPPRATHTIVHGRFVVRDGRLATVDLPQLVTAHNRLARSLLQPAH